MLEFDQNILWKYPLKEASLDFKTIRRQRKDMFRSRMRCDPKTKCKMAKIHNKIIDNSAPFLDQLFWQYLCFAKHFLFFINLRMFLWQYGWWHHLSQTQLASCSPSSDLDSWNSCNCSIEMTKEPTMIFTSRLNYTTVVAWNLSKSGQQVWNLTNAGQQTRLAEGCQS